ncbi:MAG TPA: biotin/lipoyl-containing protein [Vicinamibacterales bacterium]|nr:biotin/lipoyl-containing protein [Vicinamibacterales bacterium]
MPKRLHLVSDAAEWTAEVAGTRVVLNAGDESDAVAATVTPEGDRLSVAGLTRSLSGAAAATGDVVWVSVAGEVFAFTVTHGARGRDRRDPRHDEAFMSPMPATVVRIAVKAGDRVHNGDVLIALEAMKMELPIRSPRDGVVRAIHCREGELVQPDQALLELE